MIRICSSVVLAMMAAGPSPAIADVRITETTQVTAGKRRIDGVRTTSIKGTRMRLETLQGKESVTTLYGLPAGVTLTLDARKRRAEERNISARNAALQKLYPRERVTVALTPTGGTRDVIGAACDKYAFTIRVPMTKDDGLPLVATGAACIAKEVPGAELERGRQPSRMWRSSRSTKRSSWSRRTGNAPGSDRAEPYSRLDPTPIHWRQGA
ncbi:MAG: hypothetical protein HY655_04005 [Acidobacteria bacterium]|nr:hypothetical protein [Acidobacteriota bacterium]